MEENEHDAEEARESIRSTMLKGSIVSTVVREDVSQQQVVRDSKLSDHQIVQRLRM